MSIFRRRDLVEIVGLIRRPERFHRLRVEDLGPGAGGCFFTILSEICGDLLGRSLALASGKNRGT